MAEFSRAGEAEISDYESVSEVVFFYERISIGLILRVLPIKKGHQIGSPFLLASAWEDYFSFSLEVPAKKPLL